jgi:hypothetical protein
VTPQIFTDDARPQTTGPISFESPSLTADRPAFELKFLLTEPQACEVVERIAGRLATDPHADPRRGNSYETTSVYFDTPQFDVYRRMGSFKRRKHRLRRYGQAEWVFLERKTKWGDRVRKRRSMVPQVDLTLLTRPFVPEIEAPKATVASSLDNPQWPGDWFHRHLQRRQLRPVCRITYERVALLGHSSEGPLRLTFDRQVRGAMSHDWRLDPVIDGRGILAGEVICEFKYHSALPSLFKEIIQGMCLSPHPVSKYRTFLRETMDV